MLKIVLVDDERIVVEGLSQIIDWNKLGIQLIGKAYNGKMALEQIVRECPDIVITDIKMPVMDGLQLIEQTRKKNIKTTFIILSGFGEFEYAKQALKFGVKDYLLKPCNEKEIENSLLKIVSELNQENISESGEENLEQEENIDTICVTQIKACIERYISNSELSLKWIAENHLYMNPDYLSKQFVKITGERFSNYLNRMRVAKAKQLLECSQCEKIASIAEEIGLGHNPQYFSKIFKKTVGYTPSQYQKLYYMKECKNMKQEIV